MNGVFSLIQYAPDPMRGETANVGLALLCPEAEFLRARTTTNHDWVRAFFDVRGQDLANLRELERSLVRRIERKTPELLRPEGFARFARLQVNDLILTPPTSVWVDDASATFETMFAEFVGAPRAQRTSVSNLRPRLRSLFKGFVRNKYARENVKLSVPVIGRELEMDYAFRNGVMNFVRVRSIAAKGAESEPLSLLTEWDLVRKHGEQAIRRAKLIVPMPIPYDDAEGKTRERLTNIYREYDVMPFYEEDIARLEEKVVREIAQTPFALPML